MKILILGLSIIALASADTVSTLTGDVVGTTVTYKDKSVKRFLGIPFAEPPVGKLRFKKTVPVTPWSEPLKADTFPPSCVQYYPFKYPWVDKMPGDSEDCLYLNIWVLEDASQDGPKAVMFFVFSGGFSTGSNRLPVYDGSVLAAEGDVIVVTVNYRLNIFGFLSTDTEDAPGNMGLFDVLEALKWVNNNIQAFGGDKDKITVLGHSAGAVTAGYLTVSPLSKGLFQRILMESGSPAAMLGDTKKQNLKLGQKVAEAVGCASKLIKLKDDPHGIVECLREIPADVLVKVINTFKPTSIITFNPIYGDEFLPVEPHTAIQAGAFQYVDVLAGNVQDEGSVSLVTTEPLLSGPYGELDPKFNKTKGKEIILKMFKNFPFKHDVARHYLSGVDEYDFDTVRSQTYHSQGDFQLICPTIYTLERFADKGNNAYYYYFEHQTANTVYAPWMGVSHFMEVQFVFGRPLDKPGNYTKGEEMLSKILIDEWTSFAKNGAPSSAWRKYSRLDPYIHEFYVEKGNDNSLKQHLANCEYFRPYFGF